MANLIKRNLFAAFSLVLMVSGSHLFAQSTTYITFDQSCMSRYLYEDVKSSDNQFFHDYHIPLTETETTVIRAKKSISYKKSEYTMSDKVTSICNDINPNAFQAMIGKLEIGEQNIFFVEEDAQYFHVYQGMKTSYLTTRNNYFFIHESDLSYKLVYNKKHEIIEEVTVDNEKGRVLYTGKSTAGCSNKYYFLYIPDKCCGQKEIEFVKGVGITREVADLFDLELRSINDLSLKDYLEWQCNGFEEVVDDMPPTNEITRKGATRTESSSANLKIGETTIEFPYQAPQETSIKGMKPKDVPKEFDIKTGSTSKIHVVDIGDTLFSLAKKYKVSVQDLKIANGLTSNDIFVDQKLKIPGTEVLIAKASFKYDLTD